jgi:transcriptional regulator with XRE-family HTH domain
MTLDRTEIVCHPARMSPVADFASRVRRLRKALTLSQQELATRTQLHRSHLAKIELGLLEPTLGTIEKLARALHVTPGQLFGDKPGAARRATKRRKP